MPQYGDQEVCPDCRGTGWQYAEGKGARPCACRQTRIIQNATQNLISSANIPPRFRLASFDNFETYCRSLQNALNRCRRFADQYPVVNTGLLLQGNPGVGKTHLAIAVLNALLAKDTPVLFYDVRELLKTIQESYSQTARASELKILSPALDAEVLVLDELGAAKPTEWVQEAMTFIINRRYNYCKTTIFTTNYLDHPIGSSYDETLADRVGARIRSRLHEMSSRILIEGEDYRSRLDNQSEPPKLTLLNKPGS
ncbi:MAG: ATP-binding protein [Blastocatellia bacterium]